MSKYKNLEKELDLIFGIFSDDLKQRIVNAVKKDFDSLNKVSSENTISSILDIFNSTFNKKSRIVSKKVGQRYNEILKYYQIQDIKQAMLNAKQDEFHKDNGYKYCTLEYFSRLEQMDKWVNATQVKESTGFVAPKFYVKE